ncbi:MULTISPECIES: SDR family NAD(P)-dependent oxidoreductase [unclassified Schaalia]|uniref:SDR family NAD(P)-dependent oxidoreductase n=1 Tax=unclassified Schaalia TaxID=2691889 RepID=UPI001E4A7E8A|nr:MULTISPECIES: SDR family NAD(P)-dependent oxidoreductase [unclassified Schaalia]MCD4549940.1 SDR family NAD(P)-dependent oxidoreductase [Schaalia sp. lx-260]MCD4557702.1 SDR family NAD(P)-dependent oxidoreductase [Schaalia sp. lx-100]
MGTALVTGATSGLGEEFCWQLARAGHDVILVARRENLLHDLALKLHEHAGVRTQVIVADLTDPKDLARVAQRLTLTERSHDINYQPVDLLVNNAGHGLGRAFVSNDLECETRALDLMVHAVMVLSYHATRQMIQRGHGAIVNVSSVASETGAGTYSAHKAWVKAFTEGLSMELSGTGVSATCVMPGPTRTAFFENAGVAVHDLPSWAWSHPQSVVSQTLAAVRRGRVLVTPDPLNKVLMGAMRLAPRWVTRAVVKNIPHM